MTVRLGDAAVQLQAWDDRIIRVRYAATGKWTNPSVSAVIGSPSAKFEMADSPQYVGLKTAAVEARVDRQSGAVSFVDSTTGKTFLAEAANGRAINRTQIGGKTIEGPAQTFIRQPGEAIIGLGQHQDGMFDYRNVKVRLMQENTKIGIPVLPSSAGYTLLWDNPAVTDVDAVNATVKWASEAGDTTDYYVCYGPDLNDAIAGYRKLTGAAPMFGRWAWGFWQSRERYASQNELINIAEEYRKRKIPLDGVVQDWHYWSPQPWGSHAFGPAYPDPTAALKRLHDDHVHAIISVWAKFDQGSKNYDELEAAGNLYSPAYTNGARG